MNLFLMSSANIFRVIALLVVASAISCEPIGKKDLSLDGKWMIEYFALQYNKLGTGDVTFDSSGTPFAIETDMVMAIQDGVIKITAGSDSFTWRIERISGEIGKLSEIDLMAETTKLPQQKGIFLLDKDVLIICYPADASERPTEFKIGPKQQGVMLRARRN
jgi:hypothetical protein